MLDTPDRVKATGGDTIGFAVLAGRSEDGKKVQVLISNYEIQEPKGPPAQTAAPGIRGLARRKGIHYESNRGYELAVSGLPWSGRDSSVKRYRVSEKEDFALVGETTGKGSAFSIASPLPPPAVELIVFEQR